MLSILYTHIYPFQQQSVKNKFWLCDHTAHCVLIECERWQPPPPLNRIKTKFWGTPFQRHIYLHFKLLRAGFPLSVSLFSNSYFSSPFLFYLQHEIYLPHLQFKSSKCFQIYMYIFFLPTLNNSPIIIILNFKKRFQFQLLITKDWKL